jgi:hypothetical protein
MTEAEPRAALSRCRNFINRQQPVFCCSTKKPQNNAIRLISRDFKELLAELSLTYTQGELVTGDVCQSDFFLL